MLASENTFGVAVEAVQAFGDVSRIRDWQVARYMRDAKLRDISAGTNEIRRTLIGREPIGAVGQWPGGGSTSGRCAIA